MRYKFRVLTIVMLIMCIVINEVGVFAYYVDNKIFQYDIQPKYLKIIIEDQQYNQDMGLITIGKVDMIAIRPLAEALEYAVSWDEHTETVTLYNESKGQYEFRINDTFAIRNEIQRISLYTSPLIISESMYLSFDDIENCLKLDIQNDGDTIRIKSTDNYRSINDFSFLYYHINMDMIYSKMGTPDYADDIIVIYELSRGRKLILKHYGIGILEDVVVELSNGEQISVGYYEHDKTIDFYSLTYKFYENIYNVEERKDFLLTRADCLSFVMLAIGGMYYANGLNNDASQMWDYSKELWNSSSFDDDKYYYDLIKRIIFESHFELTMLGVFHAKVAYGECINGNNSEFIYFNELRYVTLKEALAFMVRCLCPNEYGLDNLNKTFNIAKEKGLILSNDSFFSRPDAEITVAEMQIILGRFLHQPRGLYVRFNDVSSPFERNFLCEKDMLGSKTYYEMLNELYGPDFTEALLKYDGTEYDPSWHSDSKVSYRWEDQFLK